MLEPLRILQWRHGLTQLAESLLLQLQVRAVEAQLQLQIDFSALKFRDSRCAAELVQLFLRRNQLAAEGRMFVC